MSIYTQGMYEYIRNIGSTASHKMWKGNDWILRISSLRNPSLTHDFLALSQGVLISNIKNFTLE